MLCVLSEFLILFRIPLHPPHSFMCPNCLSSYEMSSFFLNFWIARILSSERVRIGKIKPNLKMNHGIKYAETGGNKTISNLFFIRVFDANSNNKTRIKKGESKNRHIWFESVKKSIVALSVSIKFTSAFFYAFLSNACLNFLSIFPFLFHSFFPWALVAAD